MEFSLSEPKQNVTSPFWRVLSVNRIQPSSGFLVGLTNDFASEERLLGDNPDDWRDDAAGDGGRGKGGLRLRLIDSGSYEDDFFPGAAKHRRKMSTIS